MAAEVSETLQYRGFRGNRRFRGLRETRGGRGFNHYLCSSAYINIHFDEFNS